jgi:outer membrane lipoprotein carrier protein
MIMLKSTSALSVLVAAALCTCVPLAHADAVATLRAFVHDVQTGQGNFTQTVTSPDGKKVRKSSGSLEFARPNRFRFEYNKPIEQTIVGDGQKVWLYDADLNQVTVRPMGQAVGATPAALLAGGSLDKDFALKAMPPASASTVTAAASANASAAVQAAALIEWVEAVPRQKDGQFQSVKVGFRGTTLVALEVLDSFGQKSRMDFSAFNSKVALPPARFEFKPPSGADVLQQP